MLLSSFQLLTVHVEVDRCSMEFRCGWLAQSNRLSSVVQFCSHCCIGSPRQLLAPIEHMLIRLLIYPQYIYYFISPVFVHLIDSKKIRSGDIKSVYVRSARKPSRCLYWPIVVMIGLPYLILNPMVCKNGAVSVKWWWVLVCSATSIIINTIFYHGYYSICCCISLVDIGYNGKHYHIFDRMPISSNDWQETTTLSDL